MKTDQPMQSDEKLDTESSAAGKAWRPAIIALAVVLAIILLLYRETALAMAVIWARSDTFAHGFLVAPISLWLIWRARHAVLAEPLRPSFLVLPLLAGAGFAWLLGELAAVAAVSQFALTALVVLAVPAVLGLAAARKIAFPLAFLFFSVPFGEFALPQLMEWTATATIQGLRLSGIPVYREGLHFVIPSGSWSVVEACSGVRYLIASLMVGTLFAYLSYRSLKRRLIFVAVSFIVPILANWLRAYMIVMLGHFSGNKLAVGVDHLIYGWLFFGVVIMAMFWIGARWREDPGMPGDAPSPCSEHLDSGLRRNDELPSTNALLRASLLVIVLAAMWPFGEWRIVHGTPQPAIPRIEPVAAAGGWASEEGGLTGWTPRFDNPSASMHGTFRKDGRPVGVYMAYYRDQGEERKLITSTNVLVASNDRNWIRAGGGARQSQIGDQSLNLRTTELRGTDASRLAVWQWYWVGGRLTASDHVAKVYTALNRLLGQGDDSAVIIVYTPRNGGAAGESLLQEFIAAHAPAIEQALQKTRRGRD